MVNENEILRPWVGHRGRRLGLGLLLGIACLMSLSGKARAADCATPEACYNAAAWTKAVAADYNNKAYWFQQATRQNFIDAKQWNDKATFAFYAGDAVAATWYKAIANDYAHKAAANAKASTDYFNQAKYWSTVTADSMQRAMALTSFFNRGPTASEELQDAQAPGVEPDTTTVPAGTTAPERCKNPRNREWQGGGIHVKAVVSDFCYRKPRQVTGVTVDADPYVTGTADAAVTADGCTQEPSWYDWRGHGSRSGRKILVSCRFKGKLFGIVPISVAHMDCRVALYFHGDGSYGYTKPDKMRCEYHGDISLPHIPFPSIPTPPGVH